MQQLFSLLSPHIHTHIQCTCTSMYMYMYVHVHAYMHTHTHTHTHTITHTHAHTLTHKHSNTHTRLHTHTHTHSHTLTHTHTHTQLVPHNPHRVSCCGRYFCQPCITEWTLTQQFQCPSCLRLNCSHHSDPSLSQRVLHLPIYCTSRHKGCTWQGLMRDLQVCVCVQVFLGGLRGSKFGVDYLLYKGGPESYHSSYAVIAPPLSYSQF